MMGPSSRLGRLTGVWGVTCARARGKVVVLHWGQQWGLGASGSGGLVRKTGADKTQLKICFNWGPTSKTMGIFYHILPGKHDR